MPSLHPVSPTPAPLVVICAWCPTFNRADPRNAHASHTICPACLARMDVLIAASNFLWEGRAA